MQRVKGGSVLKGKAPHPLLLTYHPGETDMIVQESKSTPRADFSSSTSVKKAHYQSTHLPGTARPFSLQAFTTSLQELKPPTHTRSLPMHSDNTQAAAITFKRHLKQGGRAKQFHPYPNRQKGVMMATVSLPEHVVGTECQKGTVPTIFKLGKTMLNQLTSGLVTVRNPTLKS